jgi:probable F420-dependent oxidoreductase
MDYGLILPTMPAGASAEGIEAGAETAASLGWSTVWTTDHVAVERASADEYGLIFEAITTLAWIGSKQSDLRLGTSVIVIPQRNAVVVAKELATLDALSGGRVLAGIGIGWDEAEYGNLGMSDRFRVRGAYLDETIRLWRHLWSGSTEPFEGRFNRLEDFTFGPLPAQGATLPILVGARSEAALLRVGRLADGYHSSAAGPDQIAERLPTIRRGAEDAGRPMPALSARVRVDLEGTESPGSYRIAGSPAAMAAEIRRFAEIGVTHLAFAFGETDPGRLTSAMLRFDREVLATLT